MLKMTGAKRRYRLDMERSFSPITVLLIAFGVIINVLGARSVIALGLPLYLDNIGSVLAAILGGPIPGMVTAFVSNYFGYFGEPSAIMFGVLTVTMAWLAAEFSQRGLFRKLREKLPLGYLYRCSGEELEAEYEKRKEPYTGRSVFAKILWIITGALCMLAVVVIWYSTRVYVITEYRANQDTYALFGFVVQLIGLAFVITVFAVILSGWMAYKTVKKPLDALVEQTVAFRKSDPEKWLDTDAWKTRRVVKTKDEADAFFERFLPAFRSCPCRN